MAHERRRGSVTDRFWNLNLASDDSAKNRGPVTINSAENNRLCLGRSEPAPHPKLEIVGPTSQRQQIAERRGARPTRRQVEQRWFGRSAHYSRLAEGRS